MVAVDLFRHLFGNIGAIKNLIDLLIPLKHTEVSRLQFCMNYFNFVAMLCKLYTLS